MINKIYSLIIQAESLTSNVEKHNISLGLTRIILQHACISLLEEISRIRNKSSDIAIQRNPLPVTDLISPSDGALVGVLIEMTIIAENDGWNGVSRPLFQKSNVVRACNKYSISKDVTVENVLRGFVQSRNNGVEGHGIPGDYDPEADFDTLKFIMENLSHILPKIDNDGNLFITSADGNPLKLELLKTIDGDLICYRKIQKMQSGKCIVRAQRQISLLEREEITYEAFDFLSVPVIGTRPQYSYWSTYDEQWVPFTLLPDKLTDTFFGRKLEIDDLTDWFDDSDSRACMLYGDGGIGKTTLAVEFVHRILNGDIKTNWKPQLITFFTAKQTQWGINGLNIIRANALDTRDIALFIVRSFDSSPLDRSWYSCSPEDSIDKLANYLRDWGVGRNDHLLILDNTETLITNEEHIKHLASFIRELSRRVGRVLLTSRRREAIEARQIEITPLETDESVALLQSRARTLKRKAILQAGIPNLRNYANKLGNKPLVLEVFVQTMGESGLSLERAFDRVVRMQRQDLGEFLFTDAWNRMSLQIKHLLLLMTRLGDYHDDLILKLCCLEVGVTVIEASDSLEESRGIASLSKINDHLQISFSRDFMEYCKDKTIQIDGIIHPIEECIERVRRRQLEFINSVSTKVYGRIEKAYRHPLARAAYNAFRDGHYEDCELFYEEAVLKDSENGWLFDRYAYFLFSKQRYKDAYEKSKVATALLSNDPDIWFTRGTIESRLDLAKESLISLTNAMDLGKPKHLCLLQMAYAYSHDAPPNKYMARKVLYESERITPPQKTSLNIKHLEEINALKIRLEDMD